ncbi:MAG: SSU ribosomal protein S1p [Anaerolineae bacterium]|nr:MAG: SSU ribosomal protein S1p [Anaerolineae bacterium]
MEINDPTHGLGVEPSDPNKVETSNPNELNHAEQNSMESLLGREGLTLDFPKAGEIRQGVIAAIKENEILVSIGTKSEGIISGRELENIPAEERAAFQPGVEIPVYILNPEDDNGNVVLSYTRAAEQQDWKKVNEYLASGEVIESKVVGYNKGGLLVPVGRLRGFVPASQISAVRRSMLEEKQGAQQWEKMIGEPIQVRVIEVDQERRRLILSERLAIQETRESLKDRLLDELKEGDVRRGRVTSVADFGAFVNIEGADGLVHLSEVSWERIKHPNEVLKVGQEVEVKVISVDRERKRIGLSIRQLQEDPWLQKVAHLREGQLVEGKITHLTKFGAFARIGEDLEGLIHLSELSEQHINHPKEVVKEGEVLTLRIIKIDPERRRIGLSLRKVDSAAYADLDWKMALAEEVLEIVEEEQPATPGTEHEKSAVEGASTSMPQSVSEEPESESNTSAEEVASRDTQQQERTE